MVYCDDLYLDLDTCNSTCFYTAQIQKFVFFGMKGYMLAWDIIPLTVFLLDSIEYQTVYLVVIDGWIDF